MTTRSHKTVSSLQAQLKVDLLSSIDHQIREVCTRVVQKHIQERVYDTYTPDASNPLSYDRTFELYNSVSVGNVNIGTKYVTFEIFMDTEQIGAYVTEGEQWNQHASVRDEDVSEMIPYWIENGTEGSLWDRAPADYMEQSHVELMGNLAQEFANALRVKGWKITRVS